MDGAELADFARARGLRVETAAGASHSEQHLLVRSAADPAGAPDGEAQIELTFRDHVPVAINDVPMSAAELIESLSLIAGHHGVGWRDAVQAPAALVLHAAYEALLEPTGIVRLRLTKGSYVVLASHPQLVTRA
jgi:argininosuccinate synthase